MIENDTKRLASIRRRTLAIVIGAIAPLAMLWMTSPALASEHHPTGEFAPFKYCPLSNSATAECVLAETSAGEFTVGNRSVPIKNTITLQGGQAETGEFIGAENAETLSKTPQYVPGGLLNIVAPKYLNKEQKEKFEEFINKGITGVTETTELAGPASEIGLDTDNLIFEEGTALELPLKIKLGNAFLGSSCYIGSNSSPIVIDFTTGTTEPPPPNTPIKGFAGTLTHNEDYTLITLSGGRLVNNSYAAPEASGCGEPFSGLVDKAVNAELGLPAAAGHNTAILEGKLSSANAEAVRASE